MKKQIFTCLTYVLLLTAPARAGDIPVLTPGEWKKSCSTDRMTDVSSCEYTIDLSHLETQPMGTYSLSIDPTVKTIGITGAPDVVAASIRVDKNKAVSCRTPLCMFSTKDAAAVIRQMKTGKTLLLTIANIEGGYDADVDLNGFRAIQ